MSDSSIAGNDEYDYLIKLLALGDSSVGKTCILQRYIDNVYTHDFGSTVGVDFRQKRVIYSSKNTNGIIEKESRLNLQLWDTAGQERFKSLTVSFFRDAMGFMLMFDLTDENSFVNIRDWMRLLKINSYSENPDIVLVGNKSDLSSRRVISYETALDLAKEFNVPYLETSASSGENVEKAFTTLVDLVMERINKVVDKSLLPVKKKVKKPSPTEKKETNKCSC